MLGLGADLLPVVADPAATPAANSKIKQFGKIPSVYDQNGDAHGLVKWQTRAITSADVARWSADPRLGMCVRLGAAAGNLHAIDVDITDPEVAQRVEVAIEKALGMRLPKRYRENSPKFTLLFQLR